MRLLVTGAAGFIGSNFVRYWTNTHADDDVIAFDLLTYAGNRPNLADVEHAITFVQGDIADSELVEQLVSDRGVDVIVNFAAESHNSLAVIDPGRFFRTNAMGTQALLEAARRAGVTRFHHISTCEVYGDLPLDSDEAFTEESPYKPRTPYNASKAAADHAVRAYHETYGLPVTITNCCNNYGPYQFPEKVIALFTTNALDNRALPLYESTENKREWLHVLDHCRAVEAVLERGQIGETHNVGGGGGGGGGGARSRPDRRDLQRRERCGAQHQRDRRRDPRRARQARVAKAHRPRPSGARPPLPAGLGQDRARAGMETDDRLRRGAG